MRFWTTSTDLPLVFCENSGYDLSSFARLGANRLAPVELLSLTVPAIPFEKGKGYGEALIMRHALENSKLIGPETTVIKVTGRLSVSNFSRLLAEIQKLKFDVCLELRSSLDYADSRMFAAKPRFLVDYLLPEAERLDETTYRRNPDGTTSPVMNMERILAYATLRAVADGLKYELLPVDPKYVGYSGGQGHRYSNKRAPLRQLVTTMRRTAQVLEWKAYPTATRKQSDRYIS